MKKKILATILAILMIATILPAQVYAAESGKTGNLTWKLSDGTLTISGNGAIPDYYEELPPWFYLTGIDKIVIKDGVTAIGANAFYGYYEDGYLYGTATATSISIPASVKTIDPSAFLFTFWLEDIKVNSSSKYFTVDSQGILFSKDKKELLWIPMVTTGTVKIPKATESIYAGALIYATEVQKYTVDESNKKYESDSKGALYYKGMQELIKLPGAYDGRFEVPESVNAISDISFVYCFNLEQVVIPEGVTNIPAYSFSGCSGLCVIYLPSTLESVGEYAFEECGSMINLHYNGTSDEWNKVSVAEGNEWLLQCDFAGLCNHDETWVLHAPTCTKAEEIQCVNCDKVFEGQPALGHTEETIPGKAATCTEGGISDGITCSVCNEIISPQTEVPATGHTGEWVITKQATEQEKGEKQFTCTVCGYTETAEYDLYKKGDVNKDGSVDAKDATQILRSVNGKTSVIDNFTEDEISALADVNGDESVDAKDATQILRHVNGKTSVFDN